MTKPVLANCGHVFCSSCLFEHLHHTLECPLCQQIILPSRVINIFPLMEAKVDNNEITHNFAEELKEIEQNFLKGQNPNETNDENIEEHQTTNDDTQNADQNTRATDDPNTNNNNHENNETDNEREPVKNVYAENLRHLRESHHIVWLFYVFKAAFHQRWFLPSIIVTIMLHKFPIVMVIMYFIASFADFLERVADDLL